MQAADVFTETRDPSHVGDQACTQATSPTGASELAGLRRLEEYAAAEEFFAVVERHDLAGGERALGLIESDVGGWW